MKGTIRIYGLTIFVLVALFSCTQNNVEEKMEHSVNNQPHVKVEVESKNLNKGFHLLESTCFSCHSPNAALENKVAPTMAEIKAYYVADGLSQEGFATALSEFVGDPSEEKAIIPMAVEKYGLMPLLNLSEEQLNQIATYIYETELESKDWYAEHYEAEKQKSDANLGSLSYIELGQSYAMSTKSLLGKNLKGAIKSKGSEGAVGFCNERAYPLTDSMAKVLNTKIKRVSDRPRNPLNAANESELEYINASHKILASGAKLKPQVTEIKGKMVAYYPIVTNKMCMQCHGEPKSQIQAATLKKLNSLYPKDMAKGYAENQLRGIWVVEMDEK